MKVYIAGSTKEQSQAAQLGMAVAFAGMEAIHSWTAIDQVNPPSEDYIWSACIREVKQADAILVLVPKEAKLKGAIFEAGIARGLGKPVVIYDPYSKIEGNWHQAPGVHYTRYQDAAVDLLLRT